MAGLRCALGIGMLSGSLVLVGGPVHALEQLPILPTTSAAQAALKALEQCRLNGYAVAVTVVNREGNVIAALRDEHAGPHTFDNSFNKAFTANSLGRAYGLDSTGEIVNRSLAGKAPGIGSFPLPASPLRGLSYSAGGLVIKAGPVVIGALGVSGSPSGGLDEACAARGVQSIQAALK